MSTIAAAPSAQVKSTPSRSIRALGAVNFFLADVRDGLGPFLGIFLVGQGWSAAQIGLVMTIGGIAGMLATTPLGALADASRAKRFMVGFCAALVIVASLAILFVPTFAFVTASQIATGIAGAAIGPALAGLTLGLVGQKGLAPQLGRNEAWNHGGNVFAAAGAGFFGYEFGLPAVFILMTMMAVGSIVAVLMIRPDDIDHDVARGLDRKEGAEREAPSGFSVLWKSRPLLILAATLMLFHFGNGAMLPLLGQQVAAQAEQDTTTGAVTGTADTASASAAGTTTTAISPGQSTAGRPASEPVRQPSTLQTLLSDPVSYTAATVIIAQLTMIPIALLAAGFASRRGYFLLLVAALVALPVRGLIAGLWPNPYALIPVQMLDGVGAGLLGVAVPGLVARMLRGTGHINAGLGAVMTVQGVGASLSPAIAGVIVTNFGYSTAYLSLAAFAMCGLVLWLVSSPKVAAACSGD
ncbi:MFS transporter [Aureimonas phyllosphaerae]|uniref:MFS family permease n=1 Tax=Aureimonas phyllosphaerae TaxID=1166078 RepID=A0A7W6BRM3_9HYPH|nr:MFS transporter [Aureimonas phyllosphaerae]MBB3936788.1 MFS family permease [Aureimonas phyllosphaerae]MBB3961097.1 MFS family permease [Aureimonas phyllosphaerae]SFF25849.1 Major Facilitator Superfamily protein [Aureimonas phyllosphaerae]